MPLYPPPPAAVNSPLVFREQSNNNLHLRFNLDALIFSSFGKIYLALSIGKLPYKTGFASGGNAAFATSSMAFIYAAGVNTAVEGGHIHGDPQGGSTSPGSGNLSFVTSLNLSAASAVIGVGGGGGGGSTGADYEQASSITTCNVVIDGVDRTVALGGPFANNTDFSGLDISAYVSTNGFHQIDVNANGGNGGLVAEVYAATS
jgi:hypothetical protein